MPNASRTDPPRGVLFGPRGEAAPFVHRLFSAILLRRAFYESVAGDAAAWRPAAAVVCITALAQNAGRAPTALDHWLVETTGTWSLLVVMLLGIVRWLVYTSIVHVVARLLSGTASEYLRLLRCLGFAEAPSLLILVALLFGPALLPWLRLMIGAWLLAASIVAVRAALACPTKRAVLVGGLGFLAYLLFPLLAAAYLATLASP